MSSRYTKGGSYRDGRNEHRVQRKRDRDDDNCRRSAGRRSNAHDDSMAINVAKSRSKTDRTYNTDTEESDESCGSPSRNIRRRRTSSDYDQVEDGRLDRLDRLEPQGKASSLDRPQQGFHSPSPTSDRVGKESTSRLHKRKSHENATPKRATCPTHSDRNQHSTLAQDSCGTSSDKVSTRNSDQRSQRESHKNCLVPLSRAQLQRPTSPDESKAIGPALPPHLHEKPSPKSDEDNSISIGPVLPPHLRRKSASDDGSIGPALPPNVRRRASRDQVEEEESDHCEDEMKSVGLVISPSRQRKMSPDYSDKEEEESTMFIGPVLTRTRKVSDGSSSNDCDSNGKRSMGPALPPRKDRGVFGPSLPPGMTSGMTSSRTSRVFGAALPPGPSGPVEDRSDDSEDEVVGPMLPEQLIQSNKNYLVHAQLERRAAQVKRQMEAKGNGPIKKRRSLTPPTLAPPGAETDEAEDTSKREQWMLELPPEGSVDLGLGPRTFRMKGAPERGADRSSWTDTPVDKLRKQEQASRDAAAAAVAAARSDGGSSRDAVAPPEFSSRDRHMEKIVKKHSKKRGKESLLDMHQKELHKKKKKDKDDGKKEERRPFSREVDLKTNVFDEAQKKSIFKKAQLLDSRFSRGEAKYL